MPPGRPRKRPKDAKPSTISLTPEVELALQAIESIRRKKGDQRDSRDEIIAEGIWNVLTEVEKIPREKIEGIFPLITVEPEKSNVTAIRKKGDRIEK
jgi:hypothetical protein